ncbi:hypothetical protein GXN76_03860 [Kroppenstedtia pulmonis]|uniref:DUF3179 domain-containing protein n=1 Tax=Kroppenstedtia pulmonis TaxID=1380685 RepID=A0A7D4BGM7_9BACL|nr:hypothetical protein [Kroppenstedtia pulmonis]QKG83695.1 hypothetical protein GXN76_03860 [Kroppenstedtia pulmonis]
MQRFELSRLKEDHFERYDVSDTRSLQEVVKKGELKGNDSLLVVERGGERLSFSVYDMTYYHVAQGELAGEPYMVAF